jgi:MoxR-like ATPase
MTFIPEIDRTKPIKLLDRPGLPEQYHLFDEDSADAIRAALAAMRPLLIRGETGVGKTQLAAAAASVLGRPLVSKVVDSRTESRDLMWEFDAILRLADAQIAAALPGSQVAQQPVSAGETREFLRTRLRDELAVANYVRPGPLWWAFDWASAQRQAERTKTPIPRIEPKADPQKGCVVLLDEIDKADTDVPNGLLEALGAGAFTPVGQSDPVEVQGEPPLVVITTNEERVLPNAFVRRCLVLDLKLPVDDELLIAHLVARARAHFPEQAERSSDVLASAAELIVRDRRIALKASVLPLPGQAEYLDLLRAVFRLAPGDAELQKTGLNNVAKFVVRKYEQSQL